MGYVQTQDNEVDQLSGLSLGPTVGSGVGSLGIRGYWANAKLKAVVQGYSMKRPAGIYADWKFFTIQAQAAAYATGTVPPPVVVKPPSGGGGTVTPPPPGKPPIPVKPPIVVVKPPVGGGGPVTPPGIPPESKPGGQNYRFENNLAYPLTAAGAATMPAALTSAAGFKWIKKIFPIEKYGFIWEWKFVAPPSQVVIGPPIIAAPPPAGSVITTPGNDRPNVIQPPPGGNVYAIGPNDEAGQYYNITTGQIKIGRRLPGPQAQSFPPPPVQWFSYPPDDNGNWIIRDEAVRRGYISMTGNAGVQVNPAIPVDTGGYVVPTPGDAGPSDKPLLAGMSPWLIGGLAVAALLLFGKKGK